MSLDLYERDISERLSSFGGAQTIEPSAFDGFLRGTGVYAMKGLAKVGLSCRASRAARRARRVCFHRLRCVLLDVAR